jgi:hypothetical protein
MLETIDAHKENAPNMTDFINKNNPKMIALTNESTLDTIELIHFGIPHILYSVRIQVSNS